MTRPDASEHAAENVAGTAEPATIIVVRGHPAAAELAAVTAVLTALARRTPEPGNVTSARAGWDRPQAGTPTSWRRPSR